MPSLAAGKADRNRKVRLARSNLTEKHSVLSALDEVTACKFEHSVTFKSRLALEVERIERLQVGELGVLNTPLNPTVVPGDDFTVNEGRQEFCVGGPLSRSCIRGLSPPVYEGWQAELSELLLKQRWLVVGHGDLPRNSGH